MQLSQSSNFLCRARVAVSNTLLLNNLWEHELEKRDVVVRDRNKTESSTTKLHIRPNIEWLRRPTEACIIKPLTEISQMPGALQRRRTLEQCRSARPPMPADRPTDGPAVLPLLRQIVLFICKPTTTPAWCCWWYISYESCVWPWRQSQGVL